MEWLDASAAELQRFLRGMNMEMLTTITVVSIIMWYIIDRLKPLWADIPWGKYITTAVSGVFGAALAFGYELDLMQALGVAQEASLVGKVLTALLLMGGSSAVSELVGKIKG